MLIAMSVIRIPDRLEQGDPLPGQVRVFNCFSERLIIFTVESVNESSGIPGWGLTGESRYQPRSISVPRAQYRLVAETPRFINGKNAIQMEWDSFTASSTIDIPEKLRLEEDLILHLCKNACILMTSRGIVLSAHPCLVEWTFAVRKAQARG